MTASKIEESCSSPMLFRHSMSIEQQLMPIYNTTMHKNKLNLALYLMWLTVGCYETSNRPQGRGHSQSVENKDIKMYVVVKVCIVAKYRAL